MDNVVLLSEVHPRHRECKYAHSMRAQTYQWHKGLITESNSREFAQDAQHIATRCEEQGKYLVLRNLAHMDFRTWDDDGSFKTEDALRDFDLIQLCTVRHPVDQFWSQHYLEGYKNQSPRLHVRLTALFADQAKRLGFIRYEDFCKSPEDTMQTICKHLQLPYDETFMSKWYDYKKVTGDPNTKKLTKITVQPHATNNPLPDNADYQHTVTSLGYV